MHLSFGLTAGQALGLMVTAGLAWCAGHARGPMPVRMGAALVVSAVGIAYAVGRWPAGARGERLALWLPRVLRHALGHRKRFGQNVPGWDGVLAVRAGLIRQCKGWSLVLDLGGADFVLRGPGAAQAAEAAFRQLLHAVDAPVQIVGSARGLRDTDRPANWDPERAPPSLTRLAQAYAAHWTALVSSGRGVRRRCLLVLTAPAAAEQPPQRLMAMERAASHFAERLGLPLRRLGDAGLVALLREAGGGADARCGDGGGRWRVGLRRD